MKKFLLLLIIIVMFSCGGNDNNIISSNTLENKLLVFQRNTDPNTSEIFTKVYEADPTTGKILDELGGYPRIQASTDYAVVYLKSKNEVLTRRSTDELIRFNLDTKTQTITDFSSVRNLMILNNRIFGTKFTSNSNLHSNSIDLIEVDEAGNTISTIDTYEVIPSNPSNNRTGLYRMTFSEQENLLIVSRRLSFLSGAIDKLYLYNVDTGVKNEVDIHHYQSIISGNGGRIFALKAQRDTPNGSYYSKLIEFDKNSGEELRDIYVFDYYLSDSDELVFFPNLNQILLERSFNSIKKVDINSGELISTPINYDYRFIGGLNMTR